MKTGPPNAIDNCAGQWHDDDIVVEGGRSADYFHVISFAIFVPSCVHAGSHPGHGDEPCFVHDDLFPNPPDSNVATIEGCFVSGFNPSLGGGGGTVDTGADVVY